jgi:hypothetical protein
MVFLSHEVGFDGKQFKISVTDSLGLQDGQQGILYWLSWIIGSKDVTLGEYLGATGPTGETYIKPWSEIIP